MSDDPRIDQLFGGPPELFTSARDELAKTLKAEGDKAGAAEVKALRRPTVAAWAVNQLARAAPRDVAELVGIGDRLREAHDALLEGKGDAGVREATAERRRLVADLVDRAVAPLGGSGEAQREAISHTLDAAVAIPEAGIEVRAGRLQRELEAPSGFGGELVFGAGSGGDRVSGTDTASRRRSSIRKGGNRPGTKDKAADEAARREADERRKRVAELKRAASDAAKELKAAEADLASADEQLARAQQRRETTERRVEAAKKAVDAAAEALGELDES